MTAIVGVLCSDGVVIGADSSTTFVSGNQRTVEQQTEKIELIGESIITAGTGYVGHSQRFNEIVRRAVKEGKFKGDAFSATKSLTKAALEDLASTYSQPGLYGCLMAFVSNQSPSLCEFQINDFQPELKSKNLWYVSMGGGQLITDPFLGFIRDVYWCDGQPNIQEAMFAITWTLDHAIQTNPGGVNGPVSMAVLEAGGSTYKARRVSEDELQEHRQNIDSVKDLLREHRIKQAEPTEAENIPSPPTA